MQVFLKCGGLVCVFFWGLIVVHLQVFFFRSFSSAKPSKQSSNGICPFKAAKQFFGQPTAFIANSLFVMTQATPSVSLMRGLSGSDAKVAWKRFRHLHDFNKPATSSSSSGFPWSPGDPTQHLYHSCFASSSSPALHAAQRCHFTGRTLKAVPGIGGEEELTIEGELQKRKVTDLDALEVVVIGLSHHNAKVELREKLAVPEDKWNEVSKRLTEFDSISEASVLSTCNRFEIYLAGSNQYEVIRDAIQFLSDYSGGSVDPVVLRRSLFMLSGEDAIWHLMRVSAGLDSLIVGEGQILAQVKKCYEHGMEGIKPPAGKVLSRLLNNAVAAGKRVRSETGISKGAVSISSAAAEFSSMTIEEDCGIKDLKDANIVVLGAGKMARLLLIHLESQGVKKVTVINRSIERINELQKELPNLVIEKRSMGEMWEYLQEADICYPSTASETPIITPEPLALMVSRRIKKTSLQFVDISVPRNVHPDCSIISGVSSYNVDDLKAVVEKNSAKRKREMVEAEVILREELTKFRLWQQSLGAIPTIAKLQEKAENLRREEMLKAAKKLSTLTTKDLEVVERVTKGIVAKLLHGPMSHLKQQTELDATRAAIQQFQMAFQLHG